MLGPYVDLFSGAAGGQSTLLSTMYPRQKGFFAHRSRSKALLGARQCGKTYGVALWLIASALCHPGRAHVYITKTARAAKRRIWPQLKKLCQLHRLKVSINNSDLVLTFENGASVWCTGCEHESEADKIRGESFGFQKIAIDEPATFPEDTLEYLCTEVAEWTLLQTQGDLLLCGTPGAIPQGFWWSICQNPAWHRDRFTSLDNPHIPNARQQLDEFMAKYGYSESSPKIRREFYAEWALDTESLVYLADLDTFIDCNGYYDLPVQRPPDLTTLGVDIGYSPSPCAFVVASSWRDRQDIWVQRAYTKGELTPDLIAGEIRKIKKEYGVHRVIVDAGGGGKTTAASLHKSYGVFVEETPKGLKRPKIDLLRGGIASHSVKVHLVNAQELVSELKTILWDDDRADHHELCSDHNADATIQALLAHPQFASDYRSPPDPFDGLSDDKRAAFEAAASAAGE